MTTKQFKEETGMKVISPAVDSCVLAVDKIGLPLVWAKRITFGKEQRWIVANDLHARSYMFKSDGLFGFTDDKKDKYENSFESLADAIKRFSKSYK